MKFFATLGFFFVGFWASAQADLLFEIDTVRTEEGLCTLVDSLKRYNAKSPTLALENFEVIQSLAATKHWGLAYTEASFNIASIHLANNELIKSEFYYREALEALEGLDNVARIKFAIQINLAQIAKVRGNILDALLIFKEMEASFDSTAIPHNKAVVFGSIADIYNEMNEGKRALRYLVMAEHYMPVPVYKSHYLNNIADTYASVDYIDSAFVFYNKSINLAREHRYDPMMQASFMALAELEIGKGNLAAAEAQLDSATVHTPMDEINADLSGLKLVKGNFYLASGDGQKALDNCLFTYDFAKTNDVQKDVTSACFCIQGAYRMLKKDRLALDFYTEYVALRDSLYNFDKAKQFAIYDVEAEKKAREFREKLAKEQAEIERQYQNNVNFWKNIGMGVLALVLLAALLWIVQFKKLLSKIKSKNQELKTVSVNLGRSNMEILQQQKEIEQYSASIAERNTEINDSLVYASRLQKAMLRSQTKFEDVFSAHLMVYKPKDFVAGDFYWLEKIGDYHYLAIVDCTGHGAPGAMLSVLVHGVLKQTITNHKDVCLGKILDIVNDEILSQLLAGSQTMKDGADLGLVRLDLENNKMWYAGAVLSLQHFSGGKNISIAGTRKSIGSELPKAAFAAQEVVINEGDVFYIFSDGFPDQFGMRTGKKLKRKKVIELLEEVCQEPLASQETILDDFFENWKGSQEQTDDVTLVGFRVG